MVRAGHDRAGVGPKVRQSSPFLIGVYSMLIRRRKQPGVSPRWFTVHWLVSSAILVLSLVGLVLALAEKDFAPIAWDWQHQILGVVILCMSAIQALLGLLSHCFYRPERTATPLMDWIHHIIGRALFIASIYQCWVGLTDALVYHISDTLYTFYVIMFVIWVSISVSLLFFSDVSGYHSSESNVVSYKKLDEELVHSREFNKGFL
jgi:hypothetical protein